MAAARRWRRRRRPTWKCQVQCSIKSTWKRASARPERVLSPRLDVAPVVVVLLRASGATSRAPAQAHAFSRLCCVNARAHLKSGERDCLHVCLCVCETLVALLCPCRALTLSPSLSFSSCLRFCAERVNSGSVVAYGP